MKNFQELGAKAAAQGADFTKPTKGGDGPRVPAAGPCRLRLVGYVELGLQKKVFQGVEQEKPMFQLLFELSGKNHPPRDIDNKKVPWVLPVEETLSRNEKSNASKLFKAMNHEGKHVHFAQMLGEAFLGEVVHRKYAKRGEDRSKPETWTGVAAEFRGRGQPYTIRAPKRVNEDDELVVVPVDPPVGPIRCFLWEHADKEQWASLFIEGEMPEVKDPDGTVVLPARSRNVLQERIMGAVNFPGSPIQAILGGVSADDVADLAADGASDRGPGQKPEEDDDIPF